MYKYQITTADGQLMDRADPFAFGSELRPGTASVIRFLEGYRCAGRGLYGAAGEKL